MKRECDRYYAALELLKQYGLSRKHSDIRCLGMQIATA